MNKVRSRVVRVNLKQHIYFVTTVTQNRRPLFQSTEHVNILLETIHNVQNHYPFGMRGYVILPDHCHLLLNLGGNTDISQLMKSIKRNFTRNFKQSKPQEQRPNLWQRSFYDHVIRDERDYYNHLDYIHYNPVKHGLVKRPEQFAHSSYMTYVQRGIYEIGWGHLDEPYKPPHDNQQWEWGE